VLAGDNVNLRIVEREDLSLLEEWLNNPNFGGIYEPLDAQESRSELEKKYDKSTSEERLFIIQKRDGSKVGIVGHFPQGKSLEIGYAVVPSERRKGYGTEAVKIMVDYLFLSKDIMHIPASTNVRNTTSQRILEKAGFKREGVARKSMFVRGKWTDKYLYSILREEWKNPKILAKQQPEIG
jgi:RimJ/RimL family protein N-acetyltransferase